MTLPQEGRIPTRNCCADAQILAELRRLEAYLHECTSEIEAWQLHVAHMRDLTDQVRDGVRSRSARRMQAGGVGRELSG